LEEFNSKLVDDLPKEFMVLKDVTSIQFENFKNELATFFNRVRKLNQQVKQLNDCQLNNLKDFIEIALNSINELNEKDSNVDEWRLKLADHFCEDSNLFKLEDCFSILDKFIEKIKTILNVRLIEN
jgi:hypothetical protein